MASQLMIRIDSSLKKQFDRLAKAEGKSSSLVVRELINDYVKDKDIGTYIDGLWSRIGGKLTARKVGPAAVDRAIAAVRNKRG